MSLPYQPPRGLRNWISLIGLIIAVGSLFSFIFLFALDTLGGDSNPYIGILTYLVSPAFFFLGLGTVVAGALIQRWLRHRSGLEETRLTLHFELSEKANRRKLAILAFGGLCFLMISAVGSYKTYHLTDSEAFCGEVCHEVMEPEYVAYQHSPHAEIACAECHIGSGAAWYVKAKINGLHQVYAVLTDSFARPIETPIPNLRPPRDICLNCHWKPRYIGDTIRKYEVTLSDAENTPFYFDLLMKVGGGDPTTGPVGGIHWHMHVDNTVEYIATDPKATEIPWVRMTHADGTETVYQKEDFTYDPAVHEIKAMDCMDCHNRPSHRYTPPNESIDLAFALGRIPRELEDFKYIAVPALEGDYATTEEAHAGIADALLEEFGDTPATRQGIEALQEIYGRTFFPRMNVRWDVYPEHIGHKNSLGCFRCHDNSHVSSEGLTISASDCNSCHLVIAQKTGDEDWEMSLEGLEFAHPDGGFSDDLTCADCHTGGTQRE